MFARAQAGRRGTIQLLIGPELQKSGGARKVERGKRPQNVDLEERELLSDNFARWAFRASSMVYRANPVMGATGRRITDYG